MLKVLEPHVTALSESDQILEYMWLIYQCPALLAALEVCNV